MYLQVQVPRKINRVNKNIKEPIPTIYYRSGDTLAKKFLNGMKNVGSK